MLSQLIWGPDGLKDMGVLFMHTLYRHTHAYLDYNKTFREFIEC